jgi:type IV secretory pathway VirB10-like protein
MGRRPLVAMVAGWFAVVLAVAAITFVVVDRAGRGVGRASAAETVAVVATGVPKESESPTQKPTPSRTPERSTSSPKTTEPEPSPTKRTTPEPESTPTPREAESQTASFTTDGGIVVATCEGSQLSLDSIRPRDGWRFEKESEHGGLEVVFKAVEREVEIHVSCQGGVPTRGET